MKSSMWGAGIFLFICRAAIQINEADNFILYEWPRPVLSVADFKIDIAYKTPHQADVQWPVAIFSNVRHTDDSRQYHRSFGIVLLAEGKIELFFTAIDSFNSTLVSGRITTSSRIDDNKWHHIRAFRRGRVCTLIVDGKKAGALHINKLLDIDGQEQRVIIGGGNDRRFRQCVIGHVRISTEDGVVAHFGLNDASNGVKLVDSSATQSDALRVGAALQLASAFVPGANAVTDTIVVSYLSVSSDGPQWELGNMYQFEAYVGAMWLDANRVQMPLLLLTEGISDAIVKKYTSPYVKFERVEKNMPGCEAASKRFVVLSHLLNRRRFDKYKYVVHIDLRDSRINRKPRWQSGVALWLQPIHPSGLACGGFQAGTTAAMGRLMTAIAQKLVESNCQLNDQAALQSVTRNSKAFSTPPNAILYGGNIINSQHVRTVTAKTVFEHGNWRHPIAAIEVI